MRLKTLSREFWKTRPNSTKQEPVPRWVRRPSQSHLEKALVWTVNREGVAVGRDAGARL